MEKNMDEFMTLEEQIDRINVTLSIINILLKSDENVRKTFLQEVFIDEDVKAAFISDCYIIMKRSDLLSGTDNLLNNGIKEIIDLALSIPVNQEHSEFVNGLREKDVVGSPKVMGAEKFARFDTSKIAVETKAKKPNGSELKVKAENKNKTLGGGQAAYQKLV